jgi:hypothetical protein
MPKPWLTIFRIAVMPDLAARRQVPAPLGNQNQNTICDLPFLVFVLTTLPVSPFLAVNPDWPVHCRTSDGAEGANFPFCTFSNARFQLCNQPDFRGQGYLEAEFDTVDLLPQDLVNADVLRECSQSRDAERAVDGFDGGQSIQGRL